MRKIFKHNFVPEVPMHTEEINGHRHYVLEDGTDRKFMSVTSVLGQKLDKTGLMEWKKRVGEEQAQRISTQAANRGTAVHALAEKYVLNEEDYAKGAMPSNVDSFNQIKRVLDERVDNLYGVELPLYSAALRTAGRCDLIADFDGVPSIVDFKTSRKLKREDWIESYFLQTTCYSMMFERMYKIHVPQVAIIIAVDNEDAQVFVKPRAQYVKRVIEVFTQ